MKRPREGHPALSFQTATAHLAAQPAASGRPAAAGAPQWLEPRGPKTHIVHNSPYGSSRARYGWGSLFAPPLSAAVTNAPTVRIGISSLNAVPGTKDRTMPTLLRQYRTKYTCLEHCYPYHNSSDPAAWASWASLAARGNNSGNSTNKSNAGQSGGSRLSCSAPFALGDPVLAADVHREYMAEPDRFLYTIKANQYLSHTRQLLVDEATETHLRYFFRDCATALAPHMGPVLLQLPPSFPRSPAHIARLEAVAAALPADTMSVVHRYPTEVLDGEGRGAKGSLPALRCCWTSPPRQRRVRVAVEFRHRSWYHPDTFALLRRLGWGLVAAHHHDDSTFATPVDTGCGFCYVRLHGAMGRYVGDYGPAALDLWAERLANYARDGESEGEGDDQSTTPTRRGQVPRASREVYVFLNNSDSQVNGTTSSTVDATYLGQRLSELLDHNTTTTTTPVAATTPTASVPETAAVDSSLEEANAARAAVVEVLESEESSVVVLPSGPAQGSTRGDEILIE